MRRITSSRGLAAAAFALVATAAWPPAHAEVIDVTWDTNGRFAKQLDVPAGKFVEVCGKLAAGARVQWRFEAPVAMDFNVHYHEGKKVHYPVKQEGGSSGNGDLTAPTAQEYCWMWTNKAAADASLTVHLERR